MKTPKIKPSKGKWHISFAAACSFSYFFFFCASLCIKKRVVDEREKHSAHDMEWLSQKGMKENNSSNNIRKFILKAHSTFYFIFFFLSVRNIFFFLLSIQLVLACCLFVSTSFYTRIILCIHIYIYFSSSSWNTRLDEVRQEILFFFFFEYNMKL